MAGRSSRALAFGPVGRPGALDACRTAPGPSSPDTQQNKPAEAIEHYQRALRINPDFADAHTNWGLALAQQGKMIEAMEHFQQALQIKPSQAQAALFKAVPGLGTGKPDRKGN